MDRRSFLAAVMGAIAAPAVGHAYRHFPAVPWLPPRDPSEPLLYPFYVWDSATISPGKALDARLLPPPMPEDFIITHLGFHYPEDSRVKSLAKALPAIELRMTDGGLVLLQGPLIHLPVGLPHMLPQPFMFRNRQDVGIFLNSRNEPVPCDDPVTVSVILRGLLRRMPSEVAA